LILDSFVYLVLMLVVFALDIGCIVLLWHIKSKNKGFESNDILQNFKRQVFKFDLIFKCIWIFVFVFLFVVLMVADLYYLVGIVCGGLLLMFFAFELFKTLYTSKLLQVMVPNSGQE